MENKKLEKNFLIVIIVIIILAIVAGMVMVLSQNNTHSYSNIERIAKQNLKYNNYMLTITGDIYSENSTKIDKKVTRKGDIRKEEYIQRDGNKEIRWQTNDKIIVESSKMIIDSGFIKNDLDILSQYIENKDKYDYLKNEKYNDIECIVVQFTRQDSKAILWIDEEKGLVLREQHYNKDGNIDYEYFYDIELNTVSDEQVKLPNIDDYTYAES